MVEKLPTIAIVILAIILIATVILIFVYAGKLHSCETKQSIYCLSIACPGPVSPQDKCFGYSQRTAADGTLQCAV